MSAKKEKILQNQYYIAQPPTPQPIPQYPQQHQQPQQPPPLIQPIPTPLSTSYQNPNSLAALLQAAGTFTPAPQQQQLPTINLPPAPQPQPAVPNFPGLEALFQSQQTVISQLTTSFAPAPLSIPAISTPIPLAAVPIPPMPTISMSRPALPAVRNDVQLTIASLKMYVSSSTPSYAKPFPPSPNTYQLI